jgi:putative phage-type endonuclease
MKDLMDYTTVPVAPDTPEWEAERRNSIGASEAAAILGLARYQTALEVYRAKQGAPSTFDPLLGWIGHQSESIIGHWIEKFSGLDVTVAPGFMARSVTHPFIHASFDGVLSDGRFVQMKTAHQYAGHHWDEGIPDDIRVQVQTEMFVSGHPVELVVVWIGGREFRMFWERRDQKFIDDYLLPGLSGFWADLKHDVPPLPQTVAEAAELWPGEPGVPTDLDEDAFDLLEELTVLRSDRGEMEKRETEIKVQLAPLLGDATELLHDGHLVYTYRPQKGRTAFARDELERDHPDLAAAYTRQGSPIRVIRGVKKREIK